MSMSAKITAYKIDPEEMLDVNDALAAAAFHVEWKRCAGGRLVARGYLCPHCDSSDPGRNCGKPRESVIGEPMQLDLPITDF